MNTFEKTAETQFDVKYIGYALAALGAAFYAMKAIFAKLAYGPANPETLDVDAITLLMLRMLFSLPVYLSIGAIAWRQRKQDGRPLPNARQTGSIIIVGLLGYYLASYLDFQGLTMITAQFERLLLFTYPFFVVIFGVLFFGGIITMTSIATLFFAYAGILFIFFKGDTAMGDQVLLGAALVLGAAMSFALYQLLAKKLMAEIGSRIFTCIAMSAACMGVIVHFLLENSLSSLADVPAHIVWISVLIAFVSTIIPSFMMNAALERIGAEAVSVISTFSPVATIIMAIIILNEPFSITDAIGTAMVLGGVGLYTWSDAKRKKGAPQ